MPHPTLRRLMKFTLPVALALAVPVLFVCCTPGWLANSKGFVFVNFAGDMLHLDVDSGETKKITNVGVPAIQPAVLPDGSVAVPARGKSGKPRLRFFSLQGEELSSSPEFADGDLLSDLNQGTDDFPMIYNYAAMDGSHVVTFVPGKQKASIYDVKAKTFRTIENVVAPVNFMGNKMPLVDISPITPDGKGFLVVDTSEGKESRSVVFHPWSADAEPVPIKNEYDFEELTAKAQKHKWGVTTVPYWQNGKLQGRLANGVMQLDLETKTISWQEDMQSDALMQYAKREGVMVLMELADQTLVQLTKTQEVQIARRRGPAVELVKMDGDILGGLFPSPNRKLLVLRHFNKKGGIKVVNLKGEVIAKYTETR